MAPELAQANEDLPTLRFALSLSRAGSLAQLERRFRAGFGSLVSASMYGYNVLDPLTLGVEHNVAVNVSDAFVVSYEREGFPSDPLRAHALSTGRAAYNMALMEEVEWLDTETYRAAYSIHQMRRVLEVPILGSDGSPIGGLHMGSSDPEGEFAGVEIKRVEAVGRVIGTVIEQMRARAELEVERDVARAALELSDAAVITSSGAAPGTRLNGAAKRMLSEVVDAEEALHRLLARPNDDGGFSRRVEVLLGNGDRADLGAHTIPIGSDGELVTVLDLRSEEAGLRAAPLGALTRREGEIAVLVSEGLGDREIADCLHLSRHTVSQYVKRIYRKLEVDSRVTLTRLLLGAPIAARASN